MIAYIQLHAATGRVHTLFHRRIFISLYNRSSFDLSQSRRLPDHLFAPSPSSIHLPSRNARAICQIQIRSLSSSFWTPSKSSLRPSHKPHISIVQRTHCSTAQTHPTFLDQQQQQQQQQQQLRRPEAPATIPLAAVELTTASKPRLLHLQKADAAASLGLLVRDMRPVDASFRNSSPTIVARNAGIIIHLEHIRVIITTDKVLVFDPVNPAVEAFIPRLQARLLSTSHPMPFEFRAVEGVLVDLCSTLNAQLGALVPSIDLVLDTLSTTTDFGGDTVQHCLDRLLPLENALHEFAVRVDHVREALDEVLDSDEDMSTMYLTAFQETGHKRLFEQHDEVEMMLENYVKQIDTIHSEVSSTLRQVKATENVTQIRLDAMRNRILRLEVFLNLGAVSVATGGLVAGAFGMNLHTGFEEVPGVFWIVSGVAVGVSALSFRLCLAYLRYRGIFR